MTAGHVERFRGDLAELATLTGISADDLQRRDAWLGGVDRWCARMDGRFTACLSVHVRPDDRAFVRLDGDAHPFGALTDAAMRELRRPLHASVRKRSEVERTARAGFELVDTSDTFEVPFTSVLERVRPFRHSRRFDVISADEVDRDALFDLDTALRSDVPGTDGWRGNRAWFDEEMAERPPFDPSAYLVAADRETGALVGLVRFWRNDLGPRLGLIGVVRAWRRTRVAASLFRPAVEAAATWGSDTFTTETSRLNLAVHPYLERLGASRTGTTSLMVRR